MKSLCLTLRCSLTQPQFHAETASVLVSPPSASTTNEQVAPWCLDHPADTPLLAALGHRGVHGTAGW